MKLWGVFSAADYDTYPGFLSVWETPEAAIQEVNKLVKKFKYHKYSLDIPVIEEITLNESFIKDVGGCFHSE